MTEARYGAWRSPITPAVASTGAARLSNYQIQVDGSDVYWVEPRPQERGRNIVMRRGADGALTEITPPDFNVRTTVHEYGGGAFTVSQGTVIFSNFADQRLYVQPPGQPPRPVTPDAALRYADGVVDTRRRRLICVREDHRAGGEPLNTLVAVALDGDEAGGEALASGLDFYAAPRLSPDGTQLVWLTWDHPAMPWDGATLWLAEVGADGRLSEPQPIVGGPGEAIFQPQWSPGGALHFVSDRSGWWNLYRWRDGQVEALHPMAAEFGLPLWSLGQSTYAFLDETRLACAYAERGIWRLALLDTASGRFTPIETPYTDITSVRSAAGRAVFAAGSPTSLPVIAAWDAQTGRVETLRETAQAPVDLGYLSIPQAVEFPTQHGLTAHGFYYPPTNRDFVGPADERPPLIVLSHGGPTGQTAMTLALDKQFWTSRGFALLDDNYGGSTGCGRAYRERLNGQWGVVDVDDCVNGALYLARQGLVDGERLIIRGGSAGGYTTLCALTFRDVFKAGASHYGISDLEALEHDTHKFESRYNASMIGPYPERRDLYVARSPIHFVDRLACPMIFFQGLEDKVVPPAQAEMMVEALRRKGLPVAYLAFEGEQHGFRRAENIQRVLEAELYFYSRVFGFELPDTVAPVTIDNLA